MASFFGLPVYPPPSKSPQPRPLSCGDFELLVDPENLQALEARDREDVGLVDIWITRRSKAADRRNALLTSGLYWL